MDRHALSRHGIECGQGEPLGMWGKRTRCLELGRIHRVGTRMNEPDVEAIVLRLLAEKAQDRLEQVTAAAEQAQHLSRTLPMPCPPLTEFNRTR